MSSKTTEKSRKTSEKTSETTEVSSKNNEKTSKTSINSSSYLHDIFYENFGARRTFHEDTKSIHLKFSSRSPNVDPEHALTFKDKFGGYPITSVTYQHIDYRLEGDDNLVIEGKEKCPPQIDIRFMNILSVFPTVTEEFRPGILFIAEKTSGKIDHIKKLTIKGNITDLTCSSDDPKGINNSPFKSIYFQRPEGENPEPYKFTCLETVDLSECTGLQKLDWEFIYNQNIKTVCLPDHEFLVYGKDWIKEHNLNSEGERIEVQNANYAKSSSEESGCCNIA